MIPPAAGALLVAVFLLAGPPASAFAQDPADQPPFGGDPVAARALQRGDAPPPGYELSARQAVAAASSAEDLPGDVRAADGPRSEPLAFTRGREWEVVFRNPDGETTALVIVDDESGDVADVFTDEQIDTKLARGYEDALSGDLNEAWFWIPLCLLFVAPFFDIRRPFRLLHLDLLVLLGLSVSLFFFNKGQITASTLLVYPVLAYVLARMLIAGFRPRDRSERLVPLLPRAWLAAGVAALVALHTVFVVTEGKAIDVGVAGVIGADRILDGQDVYSQAFSEDLPSSGDVRGDVYGPVNYLAYVPFELAFPWRGEWDDVPAARAAALAFTLLTALGLFALGRRVRAGDEGVTLGSALAFAWLAYPFTLYALGSSFNDSLVALGVVACLLALSSAPARGAATALVGLTKFGPLALAPLFAAGTGERRPRPLVAFAISFAAIAALVTIPLLPDGGLRELYDRSLGYQAARGSPFSIWGQAPSLDFLQTVSKVVAVALALVLFFVPSRRSPVQVAALAAAVLVAVQVTANHWFYPYAVWFAPLVLLVSFSACRGSQVEPPPQDVSSVRTAA